ncbi:protein NRT1/ PTR FAMILY 5.6-like [Malania oleifera]|uniref:protein NRT1/ PTR FAMILY 5.6-like n=1 Tax=Malania oleifera TaxID=397392 RepID=UPI0025AE71BE|nr:protein NRT1/ PTR FAMILY 5.6-like [Malania oleifera]
MMEQLEMEDKRKTAEGEATGGVDEHKWVYDSSVDYKGKVPPRASTGVWKASLFIISIEFSERLSYFGIATNLISYLIKVIHQDLETAAKNVNYWTGVTTIMPLIGGFLADAYTGRFSMVLLSSFIYVLGLALLTMSQFIPALKPCNTDSCHQPRKVHEVVFFLAIYCISLGTGGYKPCLESFGADQFDDNHPEERKQKMSYFNWWNFALCCGLFLGVTLIVYAQDNVGWGIASLILTVVMAITIVIFYAGRPFYRYRFAEGSPLKPMLQVLVAAVIKRNVPYPSDPALLYEVPKAQRSQGRLLCHTNKLRFLDKAAVVEDKENPSNNRRMSPWRLATVTQVEELKLVLNMIPIWLTSLTFGVTVAQASTFFVKQGSTMNRKIGDSFEIPPASVYALSAVGMIISVTIYDKILVPMLRKATGSERGINILQRIGIGMIFSVLSMAVAAVVERNRLRLVEEESIGGGSIGPTVPMSVFWLVPQFMILGIGDGFTLVGLQEYFYDQVPDSMRSLGIAFYLSVIGVGSFLSSFLITVADHVTQKIGTSWFGKDLNNSRLDNFYWLLAVLNGLNLCVFVFVASRYTYKTVQKVAVADSYEGDRAEQMA